MLKTITLAVSRSFTAVLHTNCYLKSELFYTTPRMVSCSTIRSFHEMLVTPEELSNTIAKKDASHRVIPLCAAWFLPNDPEGRTGFEAFKTKHVPRARFLDIDAVKDDDSPYPHMLPTAERFAKSMSELGIKRDDILIVYDTAELGIFSAPRVAWMLQVFGHPSFHILNNFRLWVEQGYGTETSESSPTIHEKSDYPVPSLNPDRVINFRGVKEIVKEYGREGSERVQIVDARSPGRFSGAEPEPRPGLPSGHMPGSINLALPEVLDPISKAFLPSDKLRKVFESKGIDPNKPIVTTCGTGVMAAALDAAMIAAGFGKTNERRVYDGSWTEWAQRASQRDGLIENS